MDLGTLEPHLKRHWPEHLDAMTHAYNCTRHDSIGYTPYYLMFGRHPDSQSTWHLDSQRMRSHVSTANMFRPSMTVCPMPRPWLTKRLDEPTNNRQTTMTQKQRVRCQSP